MYTFRALALFAVPLLSVCASAQTEQQPPANSSPLKTQKEKVSYALGVDLGRQIRKSSVDIDANVFAQALKDGLSGAAPLMTEDQVRAAISALQSQLKSQQSKSAEADSKVEAKLLASYNKDAGDAFLSANKKKDGIITLPSGLQYKILKQGTGPKPAANDAVDCHVRATLLNGAELEDTQKRREPKTVKINSAIKALAEALPLMPVGSKWQLFVPPALAYGEAGVGPIGPNATLIYEVELLGIQNHHSGRATVQ